jgi:hypothetical protein
VFALAPGVTLCMCSADEVGPRGIFECEAGGGANLDQEQEKSDGLCRKVFLSFTNSFVMPSEETKVGRASILSQFAGLTVLVGTYHQSPGHWTRMSCCMSADMQIELV